MVFPYPVAVTSHYVAPPPVAVSYLCSCDQLLCCSSSSYVFARSGCRIVLLACPGGDLVLFTCSGGGFVLFARSGGGFVLPTCPVGDLLPNWVVVRTYWP